jgi:hypothetical protein
MEINYLTCVFLFYLYFNSLDVPSRGAFFVRNAAFAAVYRITCKNLFFI